MLLITYTTTLFLSSFQLSEGIKVFTSEVQLSDYGDPLSGAHLMDTEPINDLNDFTICLRFNYKVLGSSGEGKGRLITIAEFRNTSSNPKGDYVVINARYQSSFFGFGLKRTFLPQYPDRDDFEIWATNRWNHFCLAFTKKDGLLQFVKDGTLLRIDYNHEELTQLQFPDDLLSHVYIGRCAFDFKGSCTGPEGQLTDFNMWKRALALDEMRDFTTCGEMIKGDLVNWDSSEWDLINMTERETSNEEICISPKPGDILFPERKTIHELRSICKRMKGRLFHYHIFW